MARTTTTATKTVMLAVASKMGVVKYLQLYPQSTYVEALLKARYPTAKKTKAEWDSIVESILTTKIS